MASTAGYSATSPGWETVVSAKSSKNKHGGGLPGGGGASGKNAAANAAKKKFAEKAPRLEDVLPMEQVASFYAFEPQLKQHNQEQIQAQKLKNQEEEKNKKSAKQAKKIKLEQTNLPTKPKTVEEAVKAFNIAEFKKTVAQVKCQYPDNFMLWLRDAALYLNIALTTENPFVELEDPVDPFSQRPASVITKETKKTLILLLEECCDSSRQSGYETLLANMAHDLAKGFSVNGYIVLLQLMNEVYPTLATVQTKRFTELIKSYQNRTNVGTALLWALGQCGRKDLAAGLKIWIEYMRPLLRLRHYSRFVVTYLSGLLKLHSSTIKSGSWAKGPRILYPSQFFAIFDAIFTESSALSKDLQKEMLDQYTTIKMLAIGDCSDDHELFPEFLRRLDDFLLLSNGPKGYKLELLNSLSQCVYNNPQACISHWQQMYRAHLHSSSKLLSYLDDNWKSLAKAKHFNNVEVLANFQELLEAFKEYNTNCTAQRDGLKEASQACKSLLKKIFSKLNGDNPWFPWKSCSLLLVIGIMAMMNHDVKKKGSFEKSNAGLFLQDVGVYNHAVEYYGLMSDLYFVSKDWAEIRLPKYYEAAKKNVGPLINTANNNLHVAWSKGKKLSISVVEKFNEYLPGIKEKWITISGETLRVGTDVWNWLCKTFYLVVDWLITYGQISIDYSKEVFRATKLCVQDTIDGKIDLTDVYNGCQKMLKAAVTHAFKLYEQARDQINIMIK